MQNETLQRTPLFECHNKLNAKIVPFAGWEMPVQYSGVIPEHLATRKAAGLFDVSHMGEIFLQGEEAEKALDYFTCNDVRSMYDGRAQYTAITNERGGIVDDIIIYRYNSKKYLLCVNASNCEKDFNWLIKNNKFKVEIINRSAEFGQIAIQGPKAVEITSKLAKKDLSDIKYFHFREEQILGVTVIAARTGYTGEDGFELFIPSKNTADIWQALLEVGAPQGLIPCGLGARDSLRLEACLPLHGHELSDDISVIESGLSWIVKLDKGEFYGKSTIEAHKKNGAPRSLIGFYVDEPGIVRHGDKILDLNGVEIGVVTSGTKTPTVNMALGLALVKTGAHKIDTKILAEVRGRRIACHVVKRPFYKREGN